MTEAQFASQMQERKAWLETALAESLKHTLKSTAEISQAGFSQLKDAISYSFLQKGKRFRPLLGLMVAETFAVHPQKIIPWAAAIEMVHIFSLIHDDLPCMDDDDLRRGEPTSHKIYGEAMALLAGDALLTEAFREISRAYQREPEKALQLVNLLAEATGLLGMVGGQAIDLSAQEQKISLADLKVMHAMKTGALIRASIEGAAVACGLSAEKVQICRQFGTQLGLAFQIKDDLMDSTAEHIEKGSFPEILGLSESQKYLEEISKECVAQLNKLAISENGLLSQMVQYNLQRKI